MNIDITEELHQRLGAHAVGFETPEEVIVRLLDHFEAKSNISKPILKLSPSEAEIKHNLVKQKTVWKELHFNDGSIKVEEWVATQFKETSNLKSNIWSGPLRDWKNKSISKLILSTEKPNTKSNSDDGIIEIQIGKFIKVHIDDIIHRCVYDSRYLSQLTDAKWCHEHLCISFPLLMRSERIKEKGLHARYWTAMHKIKMHSYRFCSQFGGGTLIGDKTLSEQHGTKFMAHLKEYGLLLSEFQDKDIKFIVKKH